MNHNNHEDFDKIPDKSPVVEKECIDVGQVVAELFKIEDEDENEMPQRSRRRSHRNNFEEYDMVDGNNKQRSRDEENVQPDGDGEIEIDDIHFSVSKVHQSKSNQSAFPPTDGVGAHPNQAKNDFQRMDIAEDTPRPSADPQEPDNARNSSILRTGNFNTVGRDSSMVQLSAEMDPDGIEPTELLKQRRGEKGKDQSKIKRNVFICVCVILVLISVFIASLFIMGDQDSNDTSVQVAEDEGPTVFEKQESSFQQDGQVMAALKEELQQPKDDQEEKSNVAPPRPETISVDKTTNEIQSPQDDPFADPSSGMMAEGPVDLKYQNSGAAKTSGGSSRPAPQSVQPVAPTEPMIPNEAIPTIIVDEEPQEEEENIEEEAKIKEEEEKIEEQKRANINDLSPVIQNTIKQKEDMERKEDANSADGATSQQSSICSSLISNCAVCLDEQTCSRCTAGYEMHSGFCASWSEVCNANDDTIATTKGCLHKKQLFGDHCQRVDTTTSVTQVQLANVEGKPSDEHLQCKKCKVHYFISNNGNECKKCSDKFAHCVSCGYTGAACQVCERGTYYSNGDCVKCNIPKCQECSFSDHCNKCEDGTKFVALLKRCWKLGDPMW